MKKSDQLKVERTAKLDAQNALVSKAKIENRDMSDDENATFDTEQRAIEALDIKIERALKIEENEKRAIASQAQNRIGDNGDEDAPKEVFSLHRALQGLINNNVAGYEGEVSRKAVEEARAINLPVSGLVIPLNRAQQSVTGDSGTKGGRLVATELQSPIDFLRPNPVIEKLGAKRITGLVGNLRFPKNEGGIVASWEGETTSTPETANVYGYLDAIPKRLSVDVPISLQNLMQTNFDLEMYTVDEINKALANAVDAGAVNGSGTGQPLGVLNNPDVNQVTTATDGSVPSWDMLVDLETSVFTSNADASAMKYLVNPKTRGKLKKTKHTAGDLNYIMGTDGMVNGYVTETSNHMPATLSKGTGTNLSAIAFGDWSQMLSLQWGFMDLSVDTVSRKREGLVVITVNVFEDVLIKQAKAFAVAKGIITT